MDAVKRSNLAHFSDSRLGFFEAAEGRREERLRAWMTRRFLRFLTLLPQADLRDRHLLDAGCNDGKLFDWFEARGARSVTGCDLCLPALRRVASGRPGALRRRGFSGGGRVVQGDLSRLPFADHSFDTVLCFGTWHHIPDRPAMLQGFLRVLRPGGVLVIADPNEEHLLRGAVDRLGQRVGGLIEEEHPASPHLTLDLLRQAGFEPDPPRYYNALSEIGAHGWDALQQRGSPLAPVAALGFPALALTDRLLEATLLRVAPRRLAWSYLVRATAPR